MLKNEIRDLSLNCDQCQSETDAETMELVQIAFVLIEKKPQISFGALEPVTKVNSSNFHCHFWTYTDPKTNALPKCYLHNIWWQF